VLLHRHDFQLPLATLHRNPDVVGMLRQEKIDARITDAEVEDAQRFNRFGQNSARK
jgi:hypothetical protein